MTCEEALMLISGCLDGTNTEEEAAQLREHLQVCPACRETLEAFREADAALAASREQAPSDLCGRVMESIREEAGQTKKRRTPWRHLTVAAGLVLVIGIGAAAMPRQEPADQAVQPMAARHAPAPVEAAVHDDPAYDSEIGFFYYDHTVILDPQELSDDLGADLAVTHELLPEMEVCSCEVLENGAILYHLETADGAVLLSRQYGVELYQPAETGGSVVSYALLTP